MFRVNKKMFTLCKYTDRKEDRRGSFGVSTLATQKVSDSMVGSLKAIQTSPKAQRTPAHKKRVSKSS